MAQVGGDEGVTAMVTMRGVAGFILVCFVAMSERDAVSEAGRWVVEYEVDARAVCR